MTILPTRSQQTLVQTIVAGIQGRASQLIDFSIGSPLRAIAEGFAGLFLWFQALVLQLLTSTRLSTATGTDVDTFVGDFGVYRLGPALASGEVTFSRFTAGASTCFIPIGATVQTSDGTQSFEVVANPEYVTYSAALGGYTLPANVGSITVPVQAAAAGSAGNVAAGAASVMTSTLVGIDTVANMAAFTNGSDGEADSALKKRFSAYILGLSRGDYYGLSYAILSAEVGIQWQLVECYDYAGNWRPGYYYVVCDDGSGSPSADFVTAVTLAANAVRPLGTQCGVFSSQITWATPSLIITTAPGYDHPTVVGLVANAIENGINALGLGNGLSFGQLYSWAYSVAGVTGVSAVTLNGLSGDTASIAGNPQFTIKTNSCIVS